MKENTMMLCSDKEKAVARVLCGDNSYLPVALDIVRNDESNYYLHLGPFLSRKILDSPSGYEDEELDWARKVKQLNGRKYFLLRSRLHVVNKLFHEAGIDWMPIKGMDTSKRFFEFPEDRPMSDIDILVRHKAYHESRAILESHGWSSPYKQRDKWDKYIEAEGYNWQMIDRMGVLLELHFRLWGFVPESLTEEIWMMAQKTSLSESTSWSMSPAHVFVVAAIHFWLSKRMLLRLWELHRIANKATASFVDDVVAITNRHGLQLPVLLTCEKTHTLFSNEECGLIAGELRKVLRYPEKRLFLQVPKGGLSTITLEKVYLARLLSNRPNRMGWKSIFRRIWPHGAIIEEKTPGEYPVLVRRILYFRQ